MRIAKLAVALLPLFLTSVAFLTPGWATPQSSCSQPMKQCLFSDGQGCSINCPADCVCVTRSAKCTLGWGTDASCMCVCGGPIIIVQ